MSEVDVLWNSVHAKGRMFGGHSAELATAHHILYSSGADGLLRKCDLSPYLSV
jgi:hypothetical protein